METVEQAGIGPRVKAALKAQSAAMTQAALAAQVDMTEDAMSRSVNGQRAFSSLEIAKVAEALGTDVYWLITGQADPLEARFAARHDFNPDTRQHVHPGEEHDGDILDAVTLAYRQASPWIAAPRKELPRTPEDVAASLGEGFVQDFANRIDDALDVDVLRLPGLATDYSITIGGQPIILLKTSPNWFHSNWSLAHELGHLALGHHDGRGPTTAQETVANRFAASLLLPVDAIRRVEWDRVDEAEVASLVWQWGVSVDALRRRLASLRLPIPPFVANSASTARFLSRNSAALPRVDAEPFAAPDPVAAAMTASSARRTPKRLISALREAVENHGVNPGTLAWLLDTDPSEFEIAPPEPDLSEQDLAALLGV